MNMTLRYLLRGLVFFTFLMLASCRITGVSEKSENQKDDNYISAKNISFMEVETKIKPNYDPNSRSSSKLVVNIALDGSENIAVWEETLDFAQENNVKIVFDVADPFAVSRNKDSFIEMIKQDIDIVFANKSELNILFDSEDIEFCVDNLEKVVSNFGIKLGKEGSLIINGSNRHIIHPSPVSAKDSTGAGDMYAAGFLTSLAKGKGYYDSGRIGVQLAEEVIQVNGAQLDKEVILNLAEKI